MSKKLNGLRGWPLIALLAVAPLQAQQPEPSQTRPTAPQSRGGGKAIQLTNAEGAKARLWKPTLESVPLELTEGRLTLPRTGLDSYHALVVEQDWGSLVEALISYPYLRGRPSGHSPAELLTLEKTPLEIVPQPLPREHQEYLSDERYRFRVRYRGEPLANAPVKLTTGNGSEQALVTGPDGLLTLRLPEDFPNLIPGERDKRSARFTLATGQRRDAVRYRTQLVLEYTVNPHHWRSRNWGFAAIGLGLMLGGLLGRKVNAQ